MEISYVNRVGNIIVVSDFWKTMQYAWITKWNFAKLQIVERLTYKNPQVGDKIGCIQNFHNILDIEFEVGTIFLVTKIDEKNKGIQIHNDLWEKKHWIDQENFNCLQLIERITYHPEVGDEIICIYIFVVLLFFFF